MHRDSCTLALLFLLFVSILEPLRAAEDPDPTVPGTGQKVSYWVTTLKESKELRLRRAALIAFEIAGPAPRGVLAAINQALKSDPEESIRMESAKLLGRLYAKAKDAKMELTPTIESLTEALDKDKSNRVREAAAMALGKAGPDARWAVPVLAKALKEPNESLRREVAESLGRLGPEAHQARVELADLLKDKQSDRISRSSAAFALGQLGAFDAATSVPVLSESLNDNGTPAEVRKAAAEALGVLGPDARAAAVHLGAALKDKNLDVRRAAAVALDRLGKEAKPAFAAMKEALRDEDRAVRSQVIHALGNVGRETPEVVPLLIDATQDKVTEVRLTAIYALAAVGPAAKAAIPVLTNASRDGQPALRDAATEALKKIQEKSTDK